MSPPRRAGRGRRGPSRYLPKIHTVDGAAAWEGSYAHERAAALRAAGVPGGEAERLAGARYRELPAEVRHAIETGGRAGGG